MTIKQLKARIERTKAKQAELVESGDIDGAKALDATIAEFNDMIIEMADAADSNPEPGTVVPPEPTDEGSIDFRNKVAADHEFGVFNNAMTTAATPGQEFVTEEWAKSFLAAAAEGDPLAGITNDIDTKSTYNIPVITSWGAASDAVEGTDDTNEASLTASTVVLGASTKKFAQTVSDELLQDDAYGIENVLAQAAGYAFGAKALADKVTAAKGSTSAVSITMEYKSSITVNDIIKTMLKLDAKYRRNKSELVWLMSTEAVTQVMLLKDSDGRPIYQEPTTDSFPRVHGIKVLEVEGLDALGTAAKIPFLIMNVKAIVHGNRGNMFMKTIVTDSGMKFIFKKRTDTKAVPLACIAHAKTGTTDPAA